MPKVLSYTPPWLSRPSPGFDVFAPRSSSKATNGHKVAQEYSGPTKTIATRGTEVFVAVGNEIRWSNLVELQERNESPTYRQGHSQSRQSRSSLQDNAALHRVLRVGVHGAIKQLIVSPHGEFMAIATSHTIHIAVLPNSSHLSTEDNSPLKLKTFQLGPTAHVLEQSPIASILWHPLGHRGRCVVTITTDAVVRLWELNRANRYSFSEPTVAVDLRKLVHATSSQDDLSVSGYGHSKGFSPDSYEWEVASACFGGSLDQEGINGWSPMTLWVAMKEGDVYALCPLLPSKWQLTKSPGTSTILQDLTTVIESRNCSSDKDSNNQRISRDQLYWLLGITDQEPMVEEDHLEDIAEVYTRPDSVPVCPSLQGPFQLNPDLDISEDFEISDILVFGLSNVDSIDEEGSPEGLSSSVVCLLTSNCEVHMCLDLEGIEGQWLPTIEDLESSQERSEDEHTLLVIETVRLLSSTSQDRPVTAHPTFTTDDSTDFSFFVTDELGVFYVSMLGWVTNLERELSGASIDGAEFRLTNFLTSAHSVAESIFPISEEVKGVSSEGVASCVNYDDADLGHFVLTAVQGQPFAATLDARSSRHPSEFRASSAEVEVPDLPIRPSYQQAAIFYKNSKLIAFMDEKVPARYKSSLASEVRLSAATLEIMTHAHRILSHETNQLGLAASDLFSRCERLKLEFKAQILKAAQLADQIDKATGNDEESFDDTTSQDQPPGTAHINQRLEDAKTRQANLVAQADRIRKKLAQTNTRDLTEKEHAWIEEVDKMSRAVNEQRHGRSDEPSAIERLRTVQKIKDEVVAEAKDTETESKKAPNGHAHVAVPSEYRKQKVEHINKLLEREKAMLDAAQNRLEKLGAVV